MESMPVPPHVALGRIARSIEEMEDDAPDEAAAKGAAS